jgi:hypothetical protein
VKVPEREGLPYFYDLPDAICGVDGKKIDRKQFANFVILIFLEWMERSEEI